jgi:L,D-transpeptidase catalytic domain
MSRRRPAVRPTIVPRGRLIGLTVVTIAALVAVFARPGAAVAPDPAVTARTRGAEIAVYADRGDREPVAALSTTTEFGSTRTLLVDRRRGAWVRVLLPDRPNGSSGWVRARDVELRRVDDRLTVDLGRRTLTWTRAGSTVLDTPIAIGTPDNPTPTGRFYVTDLLDTPNDAGAYGPFALGLSAHSDTLSEFGGGDGQVGVHGTNQPSSIGQAESHGCIRVPNDVITRLANELALGTPVEIVA